MTNRQEYPHVWNVRIKETGKLWTVVRTDMAIQIPQYKEKGRIPLFLHWLPDFVPGLLAFYLLAVPAIRQGIYREANQQIMKYSDAVSSQGAELTQGTESGSGIWRHS